MRTIETKIYTFNELSDEAKVKAIDNYRDINVDHEWWDGDCWLELSTKQIKERKIKTVDYSVCGACVSSVKINGSDELIPDNNANIKGFYPHYTGLFKWKDMFFNLDRGHYLEFTDLVVMCDETFRKFLRIPKKLWENCYYSFRTSNGDTVIEIEENDYERDFTDLQLESIERATEIFNDHVQVAWRNLYDSYYLLMSDEYVEETIIMNEYEFTEEGNIF